MMKATLAALILWIAGVAIASAGMSATPSYFIPSADGKRLLVMLSREGAFARKRPAAVTLPNGHSVILFEVFPTSGCYDASTLAPIWQVDWYALKDELIWSADFDHIAWRNRFGFRSDWALAFYNRGKLIRSYDCEFLLPAFRHSAFLPYTTWDYYFEWCDEFKLTGNRVFLTTTRRRLSLGDHEIDLGVQETHIFDLSTGAVLSSESSGIRRLLFFCISLVTIVFVIPVTIWLRKRRLQRSISF